GLENNQPNENYRRDHCWQQCVAPVIHRLGTALKKVGEEKDQSWFGEFRWLEREACQMDPTMGVVRTVKKEDRDQPGDCPSHLLKKEVVSGAVALLRHYRGGAEHHDQSDEHENECDGKKPT